MEEEHLPAEMSHRDSVLAYSHRYNICISILMDMVLSAHLDSFIIYI